MNGVLTTAVVLASVSWVLRAKWKNEPTDDLGEIQKIRMWIAVAECGLVLNLFIAASCVVESYR